MRRALIVAALLAAGSGSARSQPREFAAILHQGAPYIELELGGKRGLFLVDTGANTSGVDAGWLARPGARHRKGAAVAVQGTTGSFRAGRAIFERFDLAAGFFRDAVFTVQDFGRFSQPAAGRQAGLIGTDFLNSYCLTLDYRRRTVRLELAGQRQPVPRWRPGVAVAYPLGLPTVTARIGGLAAPCRLDTGSSWRRPGILVDVNRALLRRLRGRGVRLRRSGALGVVGVSGPRRLPVFEGQGASGLTLEIAGTKLAPAALVVHDAGTLAGREPLALIGNQVLRRLGGFRLDPLARRFWVRVDRR